MRANRAAFDRHGLVPRMLRDNTRPDWSTTVLGTAMPAPLLLAPIGVQSLLPDGELATARAAAALGLPMVLSTAASHTIEEVAEPGDGPRWYQLYWPNDDAVTVSLLRRARAAGYTVLVVTLDTWSSAWRPHDLDAAYLPFLRGVGTAVPFSDPAFRGLAARRRRTSPRRSRARSDVSQGTARGWASCLLRERWDGPIVLKGILHPDDARDALDAGMDGVIVSNHGGRQVDGAIGRSTRCRRWSRPSAAGCRSSSTPASAPARTSRARWPSARTPCWSAVPTSTAWRSAARPGCATCSAACWPSWTSPWPSRATRRSPSSALPWAFRRTSAA